MSAKAKVKQTTKTREKKIPEGMQKCNVCNGLGYHKKPERKKS